jgi:hypothetical protein
MMAVTANRTLAHFGMRHFCKAHQKLVDKDHMDCCLLTNNLNVPITHFNEKLRVTSIYDLVSFELEEIAGHFVQLECNIAALEKAQLLL